MPSWDPLKDSGASRAGAGKDGGWAWKQEGKRRAGAVTGGGRDKEDDRRGARRGGLGQYSGPAAKPKWWAGVDSPRSGLGKPRSIEGGEIMRGDRSACDSGGSLPRATELVTVQAVGAARRRPRFRLMRTGTGFMRVGLNMSWTANRDCSQ